MVLIIETVSLCAILFIICFMGTGNDDKNLKSFSSYPDEVRERIKAIPEYKGRFREKSRISAFLSNFIMFMILLFAAGVFIRGSSFIHNFVCLSIIGQSLNLFDLLVIDLLWWRNTERIRFSRIPEKELYRDPAKHIGSFARAFVMYTIIAAADGYLLTLF